MSEDQRPGGRGAYAIVSLTGLVRTVYGADVPCPLCGDARDPVHRTGAPCRRPRAHAESDAARLGGGIVLSFRTWPPGPTETYRPPAKDVAVLVHLIERLKDARRTMADRLAHGRGVAVGAQEAVPDGATVVSTSADGTRYCIVRPVGDAEVALETEIAELDAEIAFWRASVAEAERHGVKVWSRATSDPATSPSSARWPWR